MTSIFNKVHNITDDVRADFDSAESIVETVGFSVVGICILCILCHVCKILQGLKYILCFEWWSYRRV